MTVEIFLSHFSTAVFGHAGKKSQQKKNEKYKKHDQTMLTSPEHEPAQSEKLQTAIAT